MYTGTKEAEMGESERDIETGGQKETTEMLSFEVARSRFVTVASKPERDSEEYSSALSAWHEAVMEASDQQKDMERDLWLIRERVLAMIDAGLESDATTGIEDCREIGYGQGDAYDQVVTELENAFHQRFHPASN